MTFVTGYCQDYIFFGNFARFSVALFAKTRTKGRFFGLVLNQAQSSIQSSKTKRPDSFGGYLFVNCGCAMNINPEPEDNEAIAPDFSLGTSAGSNRRIDVHIPVKIVWRRALTPSISAASARLSQPVTWAARQHDELVLCDIARPRGPNTGDIVFKRIVDSIASGARSLGRRPPELGEVATWLARAISVSLVAIELLAGDVREGFRRRRRETEEGCA